MGFRAEKAVFIETMSRVSVPSKYLFFFKFSFRLKPGTLTEQIDTRNDHVNTAAAELLWG
jgi:hypothetical protein